MKPNSLIVLFAILATSYCPQLHAQEAATPSNAVHFGDDVQPILRRHCYRCHGSKNQEASLQLNLRSSAFGEADSSEPIIVKHDADASLLIKRLLDEDYGDIMPLDGKELTKQEVATLRQWINEGAAWPDALAEAKHWAYQPIQPVAIQPPSKGAPINGAPINGASVIDHFIRARVRQRGLQPTPSLDRARLIRRVSLTLIGIPPTPEEVREFVNDASPDAYEQLVDRLLKSPRYGERWAVSWLDMARYADTNGFQADQLRDNWAYRDWVIRAFNADLPFNEFVIDQLAGDLRPNASIDQKIATGFHRMTTCNVEAGVHPEANRVNQIVDRVNTTATVFLGTTLECAQCHDHKYDPFTQQDYYRFFAYFNNTPLEVKNTSGVTWDFYGPKMDLPMGDAMQRQFQQLTAQLESLKETRAKIAEQANADFNPWLAALQQAVQRKVDWQPIQPVEFSTTGGEDFQILSDGAVLLTGTVPDTVEHTLTFAFPPQPITAIKLDVLTDDAIDGKGPGRGDAVRSNIILSEFTAELVGEKDSKKLSLQEPQADFSQQNWDVAGAIDGDRKTGWAIAPKFGKPHWAAFQFAEPIAASAPDDRLRVTLGQYFGRGRVIGKPRISIYTGDPTTLNLDAKIVKLASKPKWSAADRKLLRVEFDANNPRLKKIDRNIAKLKRQVDQLQPDSTLVMVELDKPRETFVMVRGDYENLGEKVDTGPPATLPLDPTIEATGDRLELARWLTSPQNPLLARVTVNRWWSEIFGTGIVKTPEDFGTQGEDPSHPELLDYLAAELIQSGWSMKRVHKQIVMSESFQQSSQVDRASYDLDPTNRLLARGPRFRLPAEAIRDNALAISGLLSTKMYGPPIMPYQPDDLWRSVGRNQPKWVAAANENRFRRGLYVIWKRAAPYPSFINFDAPDRGSCTVNRGRSNTPLQALTLLNDPAYVEMALALADRILAEAPSDSDQARLNYGIQLTLARNASSREIEILADLLKSERAVVAANPSLVKARTKVPFKAMNLRSEDTTELAAWFAISNTLLNLDETMTQ